jgi:Fe-S-cluster containining protein
MSLCDRCAAPGHCCKAFIPSGGNDGVSDAKALAAGRPSFSDALNFVRKHGLPFVPKIPPEQRSAEEGGGWRFRFSCPWLQGDGRCGHYEDRPDLCRTFEPQDDGLCVYSHGTEAGEAGLTLEHQTGRRFGTLGELREDNEAPFPPPIDRHAMVDKFLG